MSINLSGGPRPYDDAGIRRRTIGIYTGLASYTTNGDTAFTAAAVKLGVMEYLSITPLTNATPICIIAVYNHTTNALVCYDMAGVEIGNGTDLSGYTARFEAIGK